MIQERFDAVLGVRRPTGMATTSIATARGSRYRSLWSGYQSRIQPGGEQLQLERYRLKAMKSAAPEAIPTTFETITFLIARSFRFRIGSRTLLS